MGSGRCYTGFTQQNENAVRRTRQKALPFNEHIAQIDRMESVHIFGRINCHDYRLFVNVLRQGKLDQYPVNVRIVIERIDQLQQFLFSRIGRKTDSAVFYAYFPERALFSGNIGNGGRIIADKNDEPG